MAERHIPPDTDRPINSDHVRLDLPSLSGATGRRPAPLYPCPASWTDLIREIVDAAPPASQEQRAKLLSLLRSDRHRGATAA
jgi:hypothetical protein